MLRNVSISNVSKTQDLTPVFQLRRSENLVLYENKEMQNCKNAKRNSINVHNKRVHGLKVI